MEEDGRKEASAEIRWVGLGVDRGTLGKGRMGKKHDAYGDGDLSELSDFFTLFFSPYNKFPLSSLPPSPREEENYLYHFLRKEMA